MHQYCCLHWERQQAIVKRAKTAAMVLWKFCLPLKCFACKDRYSFNHMVKAAILAFWGHDIWPSSSNSLRLLAENLDPKPSWEAALTELLLSGISAPALLRITKK